MRLIVLSNLISSFFNPRSHLLCAFCAQHLKYLQNSSNPPDPIESHTIKPQYQILSKPTIPDGPVSITGRHSYPVDHTEQPLADGDDATQVENGGITQPILDERQIMQIGKQ